MAQRFGGSVLRRASNRILNGPLYQRHFVSSQNTTASSEEVVSTIDKLLIANRGEIACRVMNTASKMGIRSVACYSDADRNSLHVRLADEAHYIGKSPATESYLLMDKIIDVAKKSRAHAIHPGYGFLSEKPEFANLCEENDIIFIGPPSNAIRDMGIKSTSKEIMNSAGVPLISGYHGDDQSDGRLLEEANQIGYPVMLKAVRGGGGKGMRVVNNADSFLVALQSARSESTKAFGDDKMLVEKFIERPRHVEVQVFADKYGNTVYLFERDCSVQRRHQKIIEEAPAPGMSLELRQQLGEAAVRAAKAVGYIGAGTVEFILDASGRFYFMEMNTRLQVEHPVTEMISGVDLVELQIRAAAGERLPFTQQDLQLNGHSFEARIYAEDPESNFIPGTGLLKYLSTPSLDNTIRVETGVREGDEVSQFYDPMIAKLVVWDKCRASALRKLHNKLQEYHIVGLKTNIPFLMSLASHKSFIAGDVHTGFIEEHYEKLFPVKEELPNKKFVQAALGFILHNKEAQFENVTEDLSSPILSNKSFQMNMDGDRKLRLSSGGRDVLMNVSCNNTGTILIHVDGECFTCSGHLQKDRRNTIHAYIDNVKESFHVFSCDGTMHVFSKDGSFSVTQQPAKFIVELTSQQLPDGAVAPMTGSIQQVHVKAGDCVKTGDVLAVIYAMKLEHSIVAPYDGRVDEVYAKEGGMVNYGEELVKIVKVEEP